MIITTDKHTNTQNVSLIDGFTHKDVSYTITHIHFTPFPNGRQKGQIYPPHLGPSMYMQFGQRNL